VANLVRPGEGIVADRRSHWVVRLAGAIPGAAATERELPEPLRAGVEVLVIFEILWRHDAVRCQRHPPILGQIALLARQEQILVPGALHLDHVRPGVVAVRGNVSAFGDFEDVNAQRRGRHRQAHDRGAQPALGPRVQGERADVGDEVGLEQP